MISVNLPVHLILKIKMKLLCRKNIIYECCKCSITGSVPGQSGQYSEQHDLAGDVPVPVRGLELQEL